MYIIEKLIKFYFKYKNKSAEIVLPSNEDSLETEDILECKHNFMPIDSTGKIFACSKCGYVVTKKRLEKKSH